MLSNSELKNVNLTNQVMPTIENDNDQIKSILKKDKSSKITKNISFANWRIKNDKQLVDVINVKSFKLENKENTFFLKTVQIKVKKCKCLICFIQ